MIGKVIGLSFIGGTTAAIMMFMPHAERWPTGPTIQPIQGVYNGPTPTTSKFSTPSNTPNLNKWRAPIQGPPILPPATTIPPIPGVPQFQIA